MDDYDFADEASAEDAVSDDFLIEAAEDTAEPVDCSDLSDVPDAEPADSGDSLIDPPDDGPYDGGDLID